MNFWNSLHRQRIKIRHGAAEPEQDLQHRGTEEAEETKEKANQTGSHRESQDRTKNQIKSKTHPPRNSGREQSESKPPAPTIQNHGLPISSDDLLCGLRYFRPTASAMAFTLLFRPGYCSKIAAFGGRMEPATLLEYLCENFFFYLLLVRS
jgi:hypothetical protein